MRFPSELRRGVLLGRTKRFFAEIRLDGGEVVLAHCANPGSMKTCLDLGAQVWVSRSSNPKRKLRYTWELIEIQGCKVFVNPARANDIVVEAVKQNQIPELSGYSVLRREVPYGDASRIDFLLSGPGRCWVEVKNVTLDLGDGRSAFPDSVTKRGTRHLGELSKCVTQGDRAVLFYCVSREDARCVEPADDIDPAYGQALRNAARAGVVVLAYRVAIAADGIQLSQALPVILNEASRSRRF